jgi:hypothetical protein
MEDPRNVCQRQAARDTDADLAPAACTCRVSALWDIPQASAAAVNPRCFATERSKCSA